MVTKIENIPQELRDENCWVCWSGQDKVPKNPFNGRNAQSNNPSTWGTFSQAVKACETFDFDGIGFVFDGRKYFGVDLDHCLDDIDFVDEFVDTLQSYAEISKSGEGIHIICKGTLPQGAQRKGKVEMYSSGRYFICTGNIYNPEYTEIRDCTESIKSLHQKYLDTVVTDFRPRNGYSVVSLDDTEVIQKASHCRSGNAFTLLYQGNWQGVYSSQSEADLAFCNQLAFWTQRNEEQMDRIFRSSGLYRKKWDEKRAGTTYGAMTIGKACANCIDVYEPDRYNDTSLALAVFADGKVGAQQEKQYDMTDTGNAHRLLDRFGSIIRYSYNRKKWLVWTGKLWEIDDSGLVKKYADIICEEMKREAFNEQDEDAQIALLKWANRTASSKGKEAMIKECQHLSEIPIGQNDIDIYTDYLNTENGIVNLRNGELLPHETSFMMTKICATSYDPTGKKPERWLAFLNDITNGNQELQEYIQRCIGYSLTGSTAEQCAYFLYGLGNNGKSTFLDTIADMLGTYASNAQPETIMMKRWGSDGANSDIARLKSTRFVTCEEPTEGVRLNEGLLKQLTGGSKVTCRFLYADEFEYTPEFKIWIATNHKPVIRGMDFGIWRRVKLIPFEVTIPKQKIDRDLKRKLRQEFPQILYWAVQGCIKWRNEGIEEPECVQIAVKEYKQEMDVLAGFMDQCIEIDYDYTEKLYASRLFQLYTEWAKQNREYEMSSKKFFSEIGRRLPEKGRDKRGIFYKFVKIISAEEDFHETSYDWNALLR